ncbi:MAG: ZIP family metal transporter [Candidatus Lokiarchaeota archaeon]|nr:ZIP family metal transporter [Candidatus Lokiarchaeota archaeon]
MDIKLIWILGATFSISLISLVGVVLLYIREDILKKILRPLIAFSAGALLGGAVLHMLPESIKSDTNMTIVFIWFLVGFALFFLSEQFLNWHKARGLSTHSDGHHDMKEKVNSSVKEDSNKVMSDSSDNNKNKQEKIEHDHKTATSYLILVADGMHNFIGGLAIASSFLININIGIITMVSAAAHEIPQEFGDFGILVHGGWKKNRAIVFNFISALSIVPGGLLTYYISVNLNTAILLAFAAGNFVYIAAADLIPEITHGQAHDIERKKFSLKKNLGCFIVFCLGIMLILATKFIFE